MKNLFTKIILTFLLFGSTLGINAQLNDTKCRPLNIASSGIFDDLSAANLGTSNPNYYVFNGNTARATSEVGETFGTAPGGGGTQHTLWYSMMTPSCGVTSIRFSTVNAATEYNTRLTAFNRTRALDCSSPLVELASNDDYMSSTSTSSSTLFMRPGTGTRYTSTYRPNNEMLIQVSGYEGASGKFGLVVDVDAPSFTLGAFGSSSIDLNFPDAIRTAGTVNAIKVRYRRSGADPSLYTELTIPGSSRSMTIERLAAGVEYDIWAVYQCASGDRWITPKMTAAIPMPPDPSAGSSVIVVGGDCDEVDVTWPTVFSAVSYSVNYRLAGSSGLTTVLIPAPTTTYNTGHLLFPAATYDFWVDVNNIDGSISHTPITTYTTCGAMARKAGGTVETNNNSIIKQNSISEVNNTLGIRLGNGLNVYPNPTSTEANLVYVLPIESESMNISILNMNGTVVYNEDIEEPSISGTFKIDVSKFTAGVYFVKVNSNSFSENKKLIVTN